MGVEPELGEVLAHDRLALAVPRIRYPAPGSGSSPWTYSAAGEIGVERR
ncbi:MAG: hypothetical protein NXI31_25435 [bacterium]|nr:hypothetical protein [bacterium]